MKVIPMIDVGVSNEPLREELMEACAQVLRSGRFILGEPVEAFEAEAAQYLETPHALGVSSGTDALLLALMALGIGPGDEVLCPSFTFFATAGAIARVGARPVFVDSCPHDYNMDPQAARPLISSRTKAIIPVHLFGQPANLCALMDLAQEQGLWVIEDCAQAMGARFDGRRAGSIGHLGTFSFYPTKTLSGFGEGGLLTTKDPEVFKKAHTLRNHGSARRYHHELIGGNFRMDALQGALLRVKLKHLEAYNAQRQAQALRYQNVLSTLPGIHTLQSSPQENSPPAPIPPDTHILLPSVFSQRESVWSLYTLRVLKGLRESLRQHLHAAGIASDIYYPKGLHAQPCYAPYAPPRQLPVVDTLCQEVLSLPLYPGLSEAAQSHILETLQAYRLQPA